MGRIEDVHMIMLHMIGYTFMEEQDPACGLGPAAPERQAVAN
jgi:hypothetical protein